MADKTASAAKLVSRFKPTASTHSAAHTPAKRSTHQTKTAEFGYVLWRWRHRNDPLGEIARFIIRVFRDLDTAAAAKQFGTAACVVQQLIVNEARR